MLLSQLEQVKTIVDKRGFNVYGYSDADYFVSISVEYKDLSQIEPLIPILRGFNLIKGHDDAIGDNDFSHLTCFYGMKWNLHTIKGSLSNPLKHGTKVKGIGFTKADLEIIFEIDHNFFSMLNAPLYIQKAVQQKPVFYYSGEYTSVGFYKNYTPDINLRAYFCGFLITEYDGSALTQEDIDSLVASTSHQDVGSMALYALEVHYYVNDYHLAKVLLDIPVQTELRKLAMHLAHNQLPEGISNLYHYLMIIRDDFSFEVLSNPLW